MTGQQTLFARIALGLLAAALSVFLSSWPRLRVLENRRFDRMIYAAFAMSRLGLFGMVFLVWHTAPRGDVPSYYMQQAQWVLRGLVPYRDFVSSYAPLHPYLDAGLILAWHTPLAILFFSVLVELFLIPLWMLAGRQFLTEGELRTGALLYLASPISLQFVTIDGQDNVVIAVLIVLAVLLILRSRIAAAGATLGMSVAAIKFLPLLYAPAFFAAVSRRMRLALGAVVVCGIVYGGFAILHAPVMGPLAAERDLRSAGDLPYVVETIVGVMLPARLTDGFLLLVLAAIFACVGRLAYRASIEVRMRALTFGMVAATLALLAFSKKSWPPYLMLALFPICLLVGGGSASRVWDRLRMAGFAIFSVLAVAEHSYWSSMFAQFSSLEFHSQLRTGRHDVWALLVVEVLLVSGYLWLLMEAVRRILRRNLPDASETRRVFVD